MFLELDQTTHHLSIGDIIRKVVNIRIVGFVKLLNFRL